LTQRAPVITDEKLTIYQRYGGDIDGWARSAVPREKALMTDEDWAVIGELLQRLAIVKSGRAAVTYEAETNRLIAAKVTDEGVLKRLIEYA
jgi:hypothetical protein